MSHLSVAPIDAPIKFDIPRLTDREGIYAFALVREKFSTLEIAAALNRPVIAVSTFFRSYPQFQPWSRALKMPADLTPKHMEYFISEAKAKIGPRLEEEG